MKKKLSATSVFDQPLVDGIYIHKKLFTQLRFLWVTFVFTKIIFNTIAFLLLKYDFWVVLIINRQYG